MEAEVFETLPLPPLDDVIFAEIFFSKFFWQELFSGFVKLERFYSIIILKRTQYETQNVKFVCCYKDLMSVGVARNFD